MKHQAIKLFQIHFPQLPHLLLVIFSLSFLMASTSGTQSDIQAQLEKYLASSELSALTAATIDEKNQTLALYAKRSFSPIWIQHNSATIDARFLLETLKKSDEHGLDPQDYFINVIENRLNSPYSRDLAVAEAVTTMAYVRYIANMRHGRLIDTPQETLNPLRDKSTNGFLELENALEEGSVFSSLYEQTPQHPQYLLLKKKLREYKKIAANGGWPVLPASHLLKPGMKDSRIGLLRTRLKITGELPRDATDSNEYDAPLKEAVRQFQQRHGFLADGLAGEETISALNVPVEARIKQIILNMERWRTMPRDLGNDHILVNTASFKLLGVRNREQRLEMPVVVGQNDWSTPALSTRMTQIIINPEWRVPRSIATQEILPKQIKDPDYLASNDYEIYSYQNGQAILRDPSEIDWKRYDENYFPFDIVRKPGTRNPLGKVKFFIPNEHDVYLHDTPNKQAFDNTSRNLSHGCVRLSRPMDLARFVLQNDSSWMSGKLDQTFANSATTTIKLPESMPVHLGYFTAWVERDGQIGFFRDIYTLDQPLLTAMNL